MVFLKSIILSENVGKKTFIGKKELLWLGNIVFVHPSLPSFGYVEDGAETVIEALKEVVREKGTSLSPAFPLLWRVNMG